MKPQTALKLDYDPLKVYTREQIEALRDEWIVSYRKLTEATPSEAQPCEAFCDRIRRAADLFICRHKEPVICDATNHDDYYYEWLDEQKQEEDDGLDGDFPLGNEDDMAFAAPYFSIQELATIHMGHAKDIYAGHYVEYADRVLVRRGILAEINGDLQEAISAYSGVCYSKLVQAREYALRSRLKGE